MKRLSDYLVRFCICLCLYLTAMKTANAQDSQPTITVRGYAQASLPADNAVITANVEGRAKEADKAFEAAEHKTQLLIAAVKSTGIDEQAIRVQPTTIVRYYPQRTGGRNKSIQQSPIQSSIQQSNGNNEPEEVAFEASRQLYISVSDLKKLSAIHVALIKSGVERLDNVVFKSARSNEEYARLRLAAVKDARTKATAMAAELGAELASIKTMIDKSSPYPANRSVASRAYDNDPFGSGGGMGGYGDAPSASSSTLITLVAEVDIVFNLGKAELSK